MDFNASTRKPSFLIKNAGIITSGQRYRVVNGLALIMV